MIRDADTLENGSRLDADLCIIGAGAAGISIALQFLDGPWSVLLLESGIDGDDEDSQALYEGEVADPLMHSPPVKYRQRRFGGSTAIWGGRCVPYDPIDFEHRPWIAGTAWPFGLDTLLPWYQHANEICEAGRYAYTAADAFPGGMRPMLPGFRGAHFTDDTLERFSFPTDFGRRYGKQLAASTSVDVLLHANATELLTTQDGVSVTHIDVKTLKGRGFTVAARHVVVATGALEAPRLLMASRDHHADGIGNAHDQVGRNYMCHIAGTIGDLRIDTSRTTPWHGYSIDADGVYCRRRLAVTGAAQRALQIGNFVARLHHPRIPDPAHRTGALSAIYLAKPFISYEYGKRLHGADAITPGAWLRHVGNVLTDPFSTAGFLLHWLRRRTLAARKFPSVIIHSRLHRYSLDFHAEQEPNPASRVTLGNSRDALGMQRVRVDWRYTANDIRTVGVAVQTLADDLAATGMGTLRFDPQDVELACTRDGAFGGHHIGTTRMSSSPADGVVDPDCRVHGMHNLFIAGSAVFPTSSQANPTLTIVAMALRLSGHLREALQRC